MKQIALACLLGYFASALDCTSEDETSPDCYAFLEYEMEMFRKLEKEVERERGEGLAQKQSSSGTPGPVRGYWNGREPMEDESELALELAQISAGY